MRKRDAARETGLLFPTDDDLVPATLGVDGREVPVRIRLKGDQPDHWIGEKWSFRVNVRKGERVFGMERFALHVPATRNHQVEHHYLRYLREHGVLAPRSRLVRLRVNGIDKGAMQLEEHMSTELLEAQGRRAGPILRFDESLLWRASHDLPFGWIPAYSSWRTAAIEVFRPGRLEADPEYARQFELAASLLRGATDDILEPSQVFDPDVWGRLFAACEIWGADHAVLWHNLRFYHNPLTGLVEPVVRDTNPVPDRMPRDKFHCRGKRLALATWMLRDPAVRERKLHYLQSFVAEFADEAFLARFDEEDQIHREQLGTDEPVIEDLGQRIADRAALMSFVTRKNYARFTRALRSREIPHVEGWAYPAVVRAELVPGKEVSDRDAGAGDVVVAELSNLLPYPIEIDELHFAAPGVEAKSPLSRLVSETLPIAVAPTFFPGVAGRVRLPFVLSPEAGAGEFYGSARVRGSQDRHAFRSRPGHSPRSRPLAPTATLAEVLEAHPFLATDPERPGWLHAPAGVWDVEGWLVLPAGHGLLLEPGTTLRFEATAGLVTRGPLALVGDRDRPVVLEGRRTPDGGRTPWAGLASLESEHAHLLRDVVIRDTRGVRRGDWVLTGGVTLRASDVVMERVRFEGSEAEDALNLVRASASLQDVEIEGVRSDAVDLDFCTGSIAGGSIAAAGGDGLDFSGSQVRVTGIEIRDVGDKAISVGEASRVTVGQAELAGSEFGVVSKDGSTAVVEDSRIARARRFALVAFEKKAAWGPATLRADRIDVAGSGRVAVAQHGSRVELDGRAIAPEALDVERLYANRP